MIDDGTTRKHIRIKSTEEEPIQVTFKQRELKKFEQRIEVKDISLVGLGLKVPLGIRYLKAGITIEDMEIRLPGAVKCVLSGLVIYNRLGHCGIEFLDSDPIEHGKLRAFTSMRGKERKKVSKSR